MSRHYRAGDGTGGGAGVWGPTDPASSAAANARCSPWAALWCWRPPS